MNFPDHSRAGLITSAVTATGALFFGDSLGAGFETWAQTKQSFLLGLLVYIGSVFPDLDTESIPSRWAARIGLVFFCIMAYLNKPWPSAIAGALFFLVKADKHRGFTHKYWFIAAFIIYGLYYHQYLACAFGLGLLVHFRIDRISPFEWKNWK